METKQDVISIKDLSQKLLKLDVEDANVESIIDEINSLFQDLTGIYGKDVDLEHMACLPAKTGQALSLNHAASCLLDYKRTIKFLKGFVKAIKDKQKEKPNKTIHIFYAGCGPFAPFVTMVAPLFKKDEIKFSLLEINGKSLYTAEKLIKKLNISDYVEDFYTADAITFKVPNPEKYDILFSETLDSLLHRECYVPILWNLLPQLPKEVTVVPENVQVKLNFKVGEKETFEAVVFDTRKVLSENKKTTDLPDKFPPTYVSLEKADKYYSVVLDTEVKIYEDELLERSESSISLAIEIPIQKPIVHKKVEFTYHLKPQPSLQFKMI